MEAANAKLLRQTEATMPEDEYGDSEGGSSEGEEGQEESGSSDLEEDSGDEATAGAAAPEDEGSEGDEGEELDTDEEDALNDDLEEEEEEEEEEEDDGLAADTEGEADSSEGEEEGGRPAQQGFLEGGKADAFARAFSKIMEKAGETGSKEAQQAPILTWCLTEVARLREKRNRVASLLPVVGCKPGRGSKSIAKRKAEEAESVKHDREAKRLRLEMKQRGHVVPTKRGQDPAVDAREKGLQRLATRGVVRLFNAIAKAQKQLRDAAEQTGNKAKAAKLGRASFLAELKGAGASAAGAAGGDRLLVPSAPGQAAAAGGRQAQQGQQQGRPGEQRQKQQQEQQQRLGQATGGESSGEEEGDAGWAVLQKGFVGLQGGSKMKDWDKAVSDGEESAGEQLDEDSGDED